MAGQFANAGNQPRYYNLLTQEQREAQMYGLTVDKSSGMTIVRQLTGQLRTQILNGSLAGGTRLPPTRILSYELSVARNTVLQVYEQLIAEGYLDGRTGSGTYVNALLAQNAAPVNTLPSRSITSKQGGRQAQDHAIAFESGVIDYQHFPKAAWTKAVRDTSAFLPQQGFAYSETFGEEKLRRELCQYLYRVKDILCSPEQIVILPGATSGVDVACFALKSSAIAAMEDPCVDFMRQAFWRNGYTVLHVGVDQHGMLTDSMANIREMDLVYVVPSHQFPTGGVLPIRRRQELLNHARRCGAYIIEDDYDSEFRYTGEPIQTLRHLDPDRVIYLGSFSKIFSPTLRMGYMILPYTAADKIRTAMEALNVSVPIILQHAMADFIHSGQLERHIYKMKRLYSKKKTLLMRELNKAFGTEVHISGENAGMHLMITFQKRLLSREDFDNMRENQVEAEWSQDYALIKDGYGSGLILGYGALTENEIVEGIARLKAALARK